MRGGDAGNIRAVQPNLASGFDDSFRRHLAVEQRRAVLDTIARELTPDTTLGDIVDAAQDLGWAENLGELSLAELALALLGEAPATATARAPAPQVDEDEDDAADDEIDADDDADDDDEEEEAPVAKRGRKVAKVEAAPVRKPSSLDRALDRIDKALAARGRKVRSEPRGTGKLAKAKVGKSKKAAKRPATPIPNKKAAAAAAAAAVAAAAAAAAAAAEDDDDDTEAMSLDQAARLLVPLVRKLKEATMQDLEEQTHMGRRKLRFHIGQLVKHGKLRRHGMGRGTCYTVK